ncbi:MAG TPA: hypothetical protein VNK48_14415 [Xanthobacteraceae bacterium]|nr:hypothetical protein [Xanthobacteraceae bacterium]
MTVVSTQAELDAALAADPSATIEIVGDASLVCMLRGDASPRIVAYDSARPRVVACDSARPRVVAYGSSQARIEAYASARPLVVAYGISQARIEAHGSSQPRIEAYDSAQPRIEAYDSARPRIEAYDSARPRVVAYGSSQARIVAHGSSQARIEAYDSARPLVVAHGSSQARVAAYGISQPRVEAHGHAQVSVVGRVAVRAGPHVAVLIEGEQAQVEGGRQIPLRLSTPEDWCAYYGVPVRDGIAVLFKAVDENYLSPKGVAYTPGTVPVAPDWDGGEAECGGGLHFAPTPALARSFFAAATRYVACPVALADMRPPRADDSLRAKIKARGCAAPVYEVDEDGEVQ